MKANLIVILAAGRGERMNSNRPAVLQSVCSRPVVEWVVRSASPCSDGLPVVVTPNEKSIEETLGDLARYVVQAEPSGTADALNTAYRAAGEPKGPILVLHGNAPLIEAEYYSAIIAAASQDGVASLVWSDEEHEQMQDSGAWCFMDWALKEALEGRKDEASVEDCVEHLRGRGMNIRELLIDGMLCVNAYDRSSLCECEYIMNARILREHLDRGVTMIDPASTRIGPDISIGRDTVIWPSVILTGKTAIGEGCIIKNGCTLNDTVVGDGCELQYVVSNDARIGSNVKIGPYVNIRPGTTIADNCKVGDFVEVKNSNVGRGTKLPHLSYIGDADVGERVNVGCGAIFVNYDGFKKQRTTVGNDVFIGCQTNLIAPVTVGDDAYTAAGSTINRDVPAGAMAFARARQENKEGYVKRFRAMHKKEK